MTVFHRFATIADAKNLATFCRQTFYDTYHLQNTEADMALYAKDYFNDEAVIAELQDPATVFILLLDDGNIIGYTKLTESTVPSSFEAFNSIHISRIYIAKNVIGKGLGKQLITLIIAYAKANNKQLIWLGVWEKNISAIKFYEQWGFEKFDEEIFILGTDTQTDWLMKKQL